jgi:phage terminase large subunit-like protein
MAAAREWAEPARPAAFARSDKLANGTAGAVWDADGGHWVDGPFWYDERTADKAVGFFRDHLVFSEGEWAGQPFILEPWQEHDVVRPLFGWKRADGTRRFRRCYVWVARKNGKTELAAGIALLVLLGDAEPAGQVFSIAAELAQASIVFTKASNMVARSASLTAKLECLAKSIYCPQLNASFRPLSGKPGGKHGLAMSGLIGDEIHEWVNGDLYTFIHDSAAARRQPLEFLISTAGVLGTHGAEVWDECEAILAGDIEEPSTLVVIYAADKDDDWTIEATWRKANPNLDVSLKVADMAAACKEARQKPRLENDFKRYKLNMWTEQAVRWLPIDALDDEGRKFGWDHCVGALGWRELELSLKHRRAFLGLDLSSTTDLTSAVWWFPPATPGEKPKCIARFYLPADRLAEAEKRDKLPYRKWALEGVLRTTPGNVVDYAFIKADIYSDCEQFKLINGGVDRYNATQIVVEMIQDGLPLELFGQGFVSMSAPAKELERLVISNGFEHGGHPLLRKHAQGVAVETDPAGNIKPTKAKSSVRIDGIVSLVEAIGVATKDEGDPMTVTGSDAVVVL